MVKYRLDATIDVVGGFWPPASPNEITTGTFSSQQGRLEFLSAPTFKRLNDDELNEALVSFGTYPESQRINALCGQTRDGACTLLNLTPTNDDGVTDVPNRVQISAGRWRVGGAVMGLHLDSAEAESLDGAAFYFTKVHKWLPSAWGFQMTKENFTYISPLKALQVFQFDSVSLGAQVICEVFSGGRQMKSVPRIRIIPHKPKSLDWFEAIGPRLENFFTLFLGSSVSSKAVQFFQGDKNSGWLVQKRRSRREKANDQTWIRCQSNEIASALANWLAVPKEQGPVEQTVLGMVRKSSLFVETEFLALAQALEGFGRLRFEGGPIPKAEFKRGLAKVRDVLCDIWGKDSEITKRCSDALSTANEASYAQRIEQTYDLLSADFAVKLLGEKSQFVSRVKQTRNYFTHLGIRKQTAVTDDGGALFLLNQRLHALLRCVMLIDLGIAEDKLKEPILYQATRWEIES